MKLKEIFKIDKKFTLVYLGFILSLVIYIFIYIAGILFRLGVFKDNVVPDAYLVDFVWIIPGPLITDIIILYILPVIFLFLSLKITPKICKGLIKIHKLYYLGRVKPQYGIVKITQKRSMIVLVRRSLVLGFFSFSISAYIVNLGLGWLFRSDMGSIDPAKTLNIAEAMFLGTFFFTSIALLISVPIWLLEDSGITYFRTFPENYKIPTMRGIHYFYEQILEIFTGFSTILLLINIIIRCFNVLKPGEQAILTPLILIVLPLFVTGIFSFALILYEKLLPETVQNIYENLSKKEVPYISVPKFDDLTFRE